MKTTAACSACFRVIPHDDVTVQTSLNRVSHTTVVLHICFFFFCRTCLVFWSPDHQPHRMKTGCFASTFNYRRTTLRLHPTCIITRTVRNASTRTFTRKGRCASVYWVLGAVRATKHGLPNPPSIKWCCLYKVRHPDQSRNISAILYDLRHHKCFWTPQVMWKQQYWPGRCKGLTQF